LSQLKAYRSFLVNAVNIFAIKLFPTIALFVIYILYSHRLGETDYGHYQNFWTRLILLGTIACAGIPVFVITYAPEVINYIKTQIKKVHYLLYALWVVVFLLCFAWIETEVSVSFWLSGAVFLLYVINAIQEGILISRKAFKKMTVVNFLYSCYFIGFHVLLLNHHFSIDWILMHLILGLGVKVIVGVFLTRSSKIANTTDIIPLERARNMWLHLGAYDLIQIAFRYLDKFVVGLFLSAVQSGIYFNGSQEIPFLPLLVGAVGNAALVQMASKKLGEEKHLALNISSRLLSCIILPLFFFLFVFRQEFMTVLFSEKYVASIPIFAVALWLLPLRTYSYTTILQHLNKGAIINKGAILDIIVACALMYPFYLWLGLPGVALSLAVSTYIQVAYYLYHTSQLLKLSIGKILPLKNWLIKFVLLGAAFTGFYALVKGELSQLSVLVAGGVLLVVSVAISLFAEMKSKAVTE
jgi:O-antigen/teichoic acid export membrane protein